VSAERVPANGVPANGGPAPEAASDSTYRNLLDAGTARLGDARGAARDDPRGEARRLLAAAAGLSAADLVMHADDASPRRVKTRFLALLDRRASGVPLQILAGETGFHEVVLSVEEGVFVPRPETELLVEEVRHALATRRRRGGPGPFRVLDLCTGTGAVAVAVAAAERAHPGSVHAGDVDPHAARLAASNAVRCGVAVDVRRSDLFAAFADLAGTVDVVVSNPPYIAPEERDRLPLEVRRYDPPRALFDPDGGTGFHRRLAADARLFLRAGGTLLLEIGETQGDAVRSLLAAAGYRDVCVLPDLAGRDRIIRGVWPGEGGAWTHSC
jgi:release factor glutamine methyltransferase